VERCWHALSREPVLLRRNEREGSTVEGESWTGRDECVLTSSLLLFPLLLLSLLSSFLPGMHFLQSTTTPSSRS
jgi:hypothetical protein